ncbi:MAG: nucleotidyltransferase domain-containing protein [Bacteroidetes bacterium]|nr:nucleotidyltransferase domain-containing protein [Bacteroidota bacterium]
MVDPKVIDIVKLYLKVLLEEGITITKAFIYGSQIHGNTSDESDIDLMLVSPLFDENTDKYAPTIWLSASQVSYQIEPIAVGEKRFQTDEYSPLIAIVRQEGIEVPF